MAPLRCFSCGTASTAGAKFCAECGTRLAVVDPGDPGQRRPVTVVFCDLVGSTRFASAHDPEDVRDVLRLYHAAVGGALERAGGTVARFMGDGILAYFGYPVATDDAARRAVDACLSAVEAVARIDHPSMRPGGTPLACRAGIHTGVVYIGRMGTGERVELDDVVGDAPNIAARLQAVAEANDVVVGEPTRRLLEGWFKTESVGLRSLKGLPEPIEVHRIVERTDVDTRLEARRRIGFTSFVGRDADLGTMRSLWKVARGGSSVSVTVIGPAGVGKSRFVDEALARLEARASIVMQCDPMTTTTPLAPFAEPLAAAGVHADHEPSNDRARWFARLADAVVRGSATPGEPFVILAEDMHWADPSTAELLHAIHEHGETTAILMTARDEVEPPSWSVPLRLGGLSRAEAALLVAAVGFDDADTVIERCDGIPLYIEEMVRMRSLGELDDVPSSLRDLLLARLDGVGDARRTAQAASVVGRAFSIDDLAAIVDGAELHAHLATLELAALVEPVSEREWRFRHALIRDSAYESTLRDERRRLHGAIADLYATRESVRPETVAEHLEAAARLAEAVAAWERAGRRCARAQYHAEATGSFERALACVDRLTLGPEREEIELRVRGRHLIALQSHRDHTDPESARALARTEELARSHGGAHLITLAFPLATHAQALAEYDRCEDILLEARGVARGMGLEDVVGMIDQVRASTRAWQGDLAGQQELADPALEQIGLGIDATGDVDMSPGDPRLYLATGTIGMAAIAATLRREHDVAARRIEQGIRLTDRSGNHEARSLLHACHAMCQQLKSDRGGTALAAEQSIEAAGDQFGSQWTTWAAVMLGWSRRSLADVDAALAVLGPANRNIRPYMLTLRADTTPDLQDALADLAAAGEIIGATGSRFCEPLLHRVRADVLRRVGAVDAADAADARAAERARAFGARLYIDGMRTTR